jgi:hypothetical protein
MKHGHYHCCSHQLWGTCCDLFSSRRRTKHGQRFIIDCVLYSAIMLWVTIVWENGAENSRMGALMCMIKVVKDDTQLWRTHSKGLKGILLTEVMAPGTTVTLQVYCEMLNKLRELIQNKRRRMLTKGVILLHDNARPHTMARTNALIKALQLGDFWPPSLQSRPGTKRLPSLY